MSKEVIEVPKSETRSLSIVTEHDVAELSKQRALLKKFIKDQLVEANFSNPNAKNFGEGDYGIIPGTKKRCLLKPGAEKLQKLFRLGCRFKLVDKEIDRDANLAIFTYGCEIYSLMSGQVIAYSEASANSQEVKYKERTRYVKKKVQGGREITETIREETPIFDVLNTLQKMAQKRAMIGATIIATGGSEYFTQDMLDDEQSTEAPPSPGPKAKPAPAPGEPEVKEQDDGEEAPACCGKAMMVSKYPDRETGDYPFFCTKCRKKIPRAA